MLSKKIKYGENGFQISLWSALELPLSSKHCLMIYLPVMSDVVGTISIEFCLAQSIAPSAARNLLQEMKNKDKHNAG